MEIHTSQPQRAGSAATGCNTWLQPCVATSAGGVLQANVEDAKTLHVPPQGGAMHV